MRTARLRRKLSIATVAERMEVARDTLYRLEKGDPGSSLGTYFRALQVLGLEADLDLLARDDVAGRALQDEQLTRAPRRASLRKLRNDQNAK